MRAMDEASRHYVHLDELMNGVGKRLAELTKSEWGIVTAGCARKPAQEVEVGGRVEDGEGKPVAKLVVRFHPQDEENKMGRLLTCLTEADGTFAGKCQPGRYKVTLNAVPAAGGSQPGAGMLAPPDKGPGVPSNYASPTTTPWEVTIPSGGKKDLVLKQQ